MPKKKNVTKKKYNPWNPTGKINPNSMAGKIKAKTDKAIKETKARKKVKSRKKPVVIRKKAPKRKK